MVDLLSPVLQMLHRAATRQRDMNEDLAEHVSLLAAPIYAAMIQAHKLGSPTVTTETQRELRGQAIAQAQELWDDARAGVSDRP